VASPVFNIDILFKKMPFLAGKENFGYAGRPFALPISHWGTKTCFPIQDVS